MESQIKDTEQYYQNISENIKRSIFNEIKFLIKYDLRYKGDIESVISINYIEQNKIIEIKNTNIINYLSNKYIITQNKKKYIILESNIKNDQQSIETRENYIKKILNDKVNREEILKIKKISKKNSDTEIHEIKAENIAKQKGKTNIIKIINNIKLSLCI